MLDRGVLFLDMVHAHLGRAAEMSEKKSLEEIARERGQDVPTMRMAEELNVQAGGIGFVQSYAQSACALCGKPVDPETGFKDALSLREWKITRTCQACQDEVLG